MVVAEIQEIGGKPGDVNTVLSLATAIEIEWLHELFPKDMQTETRVLLDTVTMRVRADDVLRFRDLVVTVATRGTAAGRCCRAVARGGSRGGRLRLSKVGSWRRAMDSAVESAGRVVSGSWSAADSH